MKDPFFNIAEVPGKTYRRIENVHLHERFADAAKVMEAMTDDVLQKFLPERDKIKADPHLSDAGKRTKIAELGQRIVKELENRASANMVRGALRELAASSAKSISITLPTGPEHAVRMMEMRQHLLGMREIDRFNVLTNAVAEGDVETFAAFSTAPKWMRLANDKMVSNAAETLQRTKNPEVYALLKGANDAIERLDAHAQWVVDGVRQEAGLI